MRHRTGRYGLLWYNVNGQASLWALSAGVLQSAGVFGPD